MLLISNYMGFFASYSFFFFFQFYEWNWRNSFVEYVRVMMKFFMNQAGILMKKSSGRFTSSFFYELHFHNIRKMTDDSVLVSVNKNEMMLFCC